MAVAAASRSNTGPTDNVAEHSSSEDDDNIASGAHSVDLSSYSGHTPEEHRAHEDRHFRSDTRGGLNLVSNLWDFAVRGFNRRSWSPLPEADAALLGEDPLSREHDGVRSGKRASFLGSLRQMMLSSWINALLVFVPIGIVTYLWDKSPILTFVCNAIAIIPLSALLTDATERIASDTGDTIGALLNISLGNLVELILFVALVNGQIIVVQASILGSIIVNLMLILGSALLASSLFDHEPIYNTAKTQLLSCLLFVCVFVFLMPTAFGYTFNQTPGADKATLKMGRISSLMVFFVYILYFVHELRARPLTKEITSPVDFDIEHNQREAGGSQHHGRGHTSSSQGMPPRTIRFADESRRNSVVDATHRPSARFEMTSLDNDSSEFENHTDHQEDRRWRDQGASSRPNPYQPPPRAHKRSRSISVSSSKGGRSREGSITGADTRGLLRPGLTTLQLLHTSRSSLEGIAFPQAARTAPERSMGDRVGSVMMLILTSALMSMCAEFLVSTIDEVTHQGHLSEPLIGLIILPIVGNVSEYVTVVTVAAKDNLDLSIAVAVGSSIQIALCVAPLTVIAGWILDRDLSLTFNFFEMAMLVGSVLLVNLLMLNDGSSTLRTSGLKGGLMCACYVIIGIGAYLSPGE